ncbi:FadR/GntR family transcriptional regulator [Conyzicola nivalis]|uniref:GntR family transcriptional regulator n=1 Tax=Conyzicola nivalis TaxID=1477021 RepID=A0A916SHN3_9MICO|nr:FadR/GntR family transcriptional regulator [Conyzicola nivalis]GGA97970.1 GntR family transcriptional regulator [Conyzicola nivalis]
MSTPRPNLTRQLVGDLLQLVQEGVVRPGTKLPTEAALMERFSVSRTVVREALSQLQASGIVRTYQGRGSFVLATPDEHGFEVGAVSPGDLDAVLALLEFRTGVEVEAAGLAALRRSPAQLAQIGEALAEFADASERPTAAVDADFAFHLRVAWSSGNRHFPQLLESLGRGMLAIPRSRLGHDERAFARTYAEHAAIHDAIESSDPLAAGAAMRTHLVNSSRRLRA